MLSTLTCYLVRVEVDKPDVIRQHKTFLVHEEAWWNTNDEWSRYHQQLKQSTAATYQHHVTITTQNVQAVRRQELPAQHCSYTHTGSQRRTRDYLLSTAHTGRQQWDDRKHVLEWIEHSNERHDAHWQSIVITRLQHNLHHTYTHSHLITLLTLLQSNSQWNFH